MKRFKFSLQSLFTLRAQKERAAQQQYVGALRALEAVAARLRTLQHEIEFCREHFRHAAARGAAAAELASIQGYGLLLEVRRKEVETELDEARRALDRAWQDMVKATQDREALDKFRQRQRQAYDYEAARAEQKLLDDLAARPGPLAEVWRQTPVPETL